MTGSANQINFTSVYRHTVCNCERASVEVSVQALFSYIHCHLLTLSGATYANICRLADPQQSYESSTPKWRKEYD